MKTNSIETLIKTARVSLTHQNPITAAFGGMAYGPAALAGGVFFQTQGKTIVLKKTMLVVAAAGAETALTLLKNRFAAAGITGEIEAVSL